MGVPPMVQNTWHGRPAHGAKTRAGCPCHTYEQETLETVSLHIRLVPGFIRVVLCCL